MRISLIGQPGAGKTTLAQLLSGIFNIMVISSGDLARAHGFSGSKEEKSGQLDPDEDKIRKLVKDAIGTSDQYILDGFPRTIDQVENLDVPIDYALYLGLGPDGTQVGMDRLIARGRPDDTLDIIAKRVLTYQTLTFPLVNYFMEKEKLIYISAFGSIAQTLRQAIIQLASRGMVEASMYIDGLIKEFENGYEPKVRTHRKPSNPGKGKK